MATQSRLLKRWWRKTEFMSIFGVEWKATPLHWICHLRMAQQRSHRTDARLRVLFGYLIFRCKYYTHTHTHTHKYAQKQTRARTHTHTHTHKIRTETNARARARARTHTHAFTYKQPFWLSFITSHFLQTFHLYPNGILYLFVSVTTNLLYKHLLAAFTKQDSRAVRTCPDKLFVNNAVNQTNKKHSQMHLGYVSKRPA